MKRANILLKKVDAVKKLSAIAESLGCDKRDKYCKDLLKQIQTATNLSARLSPVLKLTDLQVERLQGVLDEIDQHRDYVAQIQHDLIEAQSKLSELLEG